MVMSGGQTMLGPVKVIVWLQVAKPPQVSVATQVRTRVPAEGKLSERAKVMGPQSLVALGWPRPAGERSEPQGRKRGEGGQVRVTVEKAEGGRRKAERRERRRRREGRGMGGFVRALSLRIKGVDAAGAALYCTVVGIRSW
jgi:hypothetical protein